ncbi:MAG TPA: UvrD-helicase domain-containing protein [Kofleriaceae bacterium]
MDRQIEQCLRTAIPTSFFLFAGAGSGKTRSLVKALEVVLEQYGGRLRLQGQQVAVVTYTNAACDEIVRRVRYDPIVQVATIHSFVWDLIKGFDTDIRNWLNVALANDIAELTSLQKTGRAGSKAAADRERRIESKGRRLKALPDIKRFVYSPTGVNRGRDYLNHAEVLKLGAAFLTNHELMRQLLVTKFPFLFIDESQDTNRGLLEAFLHVERAHSEQITLGLFGDMMQRIYSDGLPDMSGHIPQNWAKPATTLNFRSPRRIVELINRIRLPVDGREQRSVREVDGDARLFIYDRAQLDKVCMENLARERMAAVSGDDAWLDGASVKTLILEHHMAAKRLGFLEMFEPLYSVSSFGTSLLEGTLPILRIFSDIVMPLVDASRRGDEFAVAAIVRRESPLLGVRTLKAEPERQKEQLLAAADAVNALVSLWDAPGGPTFLDVLRSIFSTGLLEVPDSLSAIAERRDDAGMSPEDGYEDDDVTIALRAFLCSPFEQVRQYVAYIQHRTGFETHQGVKGLEFPRVLVVVDDDEARGFMFSYEKLFGVERRSSTDRENEESGKDTGLDRTRRLLYVTCSRAKNGLAIVARTTNTAAVRNYALAEGWFKESEIEVLG